MPQKLRWMRLDNAAKIYPAARSQTWSNVYRLSATLREPIDVPVMQSALDLTVRRFPSIAARLRRGVFWYYLQQLHSAPKIRPEFSYPLTRMGVSEIRQCALRVIVYGNRVAIELFHSLTDGSGALTFLKNLVAEYLQLRYGVDIPCTHGIVNRQEAPREEELEDSFQRYAGPVAASRKENNAWQLSGTAEPGEFLHLTCLTLQVAQVRQKAKELGVSVTVFLGAAMLDALQQLQKAKIPKRSRRKRLRLQIPVNLRSIFPSQTLRNFALYTTPEIDPRLGDYTFRELCDVVRHQLGLEANAKVMGSKIATNVGSERLWIVRALPLFIKNPVMKAAFYLSGEKKSCLSLSNLGQVQLPEEMAPYVRRLDFILGPQASAPHNCGVISWGGKLYMNMIRNIREPELEACLCRVLREMDLDITVQSNAPKGV